MGRHQVPCGIGMVSSRASATLSTVPLVRRHDHGAHCKVPVLFLGAADFRKITQADDKRGIHASPSKFDVRKPADGATFPYNTDTYIILYTPNTK